MFDNLRGRKFSNKCKHAIKCINSRIAMIRNKKRAMVRFLKKDVADLLTNGRDDNAYGRMDALIVEINHTYCYDLIEQCCESILKQLPTLQKQRECPQEAVEPISTLIFAAARFSDLPELCDLRGLFTERYGSHMESSVKAEFVEKIQKRSFAQEKKLQLLKDIAQEFSVSWDSSAFEHKMSNPSAPKSDQHKNGMHHHSASDKPSIRLPNEAEEISSKGKHKHGPVSARKQQVQETKDSHVDTTIKDAFLHDRIEKTRKVIADEPEHVKPDFCSTEVPSYIKTSSSQNGTYNHDQLKDGPAHKWTGNAQEALDTIGPEEQAIDAKKSSNGKAVNMAPPYTKSYEEENNNGLIYDRLGKAEEGLEYTSLERRPVGPVNDDRLINFHPPYVKSRVNEPPSHPDQTIQDSTIAGNVRYDGSEDLKGGMFGDEKWKRKPMPVSVRRRFTKPAGINTSDGIINKDIMSQTQSGLGNNAGRRGTSAHLEATDEVDNEKFMDRHPGPPVHVEVDRAIDDGKLLLRTPSGQRRLGSKRSATAYDGTGNEDEMIMDRLLIDYSKKGLASGASKVRMRSETPPTNHAEHEISDKIHPSRTESVHALDRSTSLLPELESAAAGVQRHSCAASMQPDNGGRAHPRLPDYDELAARFNALRRS
uniref:LOW QUALITY PROTEIN: uncharacterized protein LOC105049470 n=1 Tax=Elaeis guineensis var. tenera TaxID=51953 RepID=A0A6I9RIR4_ELAGV|nr:LOW QUALITY PROTEIN: uncharacterized protein LOC105049470 [Elaeis guineensis]